MTQLEVVGAIEQLLPPADPPLRDESFALPCQSPKTMTPSGRGPPRGPDEHLDGGSRLDPFESRAGMKSGGHVLKIGK
jgi:hypothetical protein